MQPSLRAATAGRSCGCWRWHGAAAPTLSSRRARAPAAPGASAGEAGGNSMAGREQDLLLAGGACPVPREQQPMYQLLALQEDSAFDAARQPLPQFTAGLAKSFAGFFLLAGLPVSCFTFDLAKEPAQCVLSAAAGSLFIVTVLVWRIYLGWDHVGARLQSATVEYEETGWYDGQTWVKTPEVLARDRLAVAYQIRPAVSRLKRALLGLGSALAASVLLLAALPPPGAYSAGTAAYQPPAPPRPAAAGEDYQERLQRFEPWALEEGGAEGAGAPRVLDHMRAPTR